MYLNDCFDLREEEGEIDKYSTKQTTSVAGTHESLEGNCIAL